MTKWHWSPDACEWKRCRAKGPTTCPFAEHGWGKLKVLGLPTLFDLP